LKGNKITVFICRIIALVEKKGRKEKTYRAMKLNCRTEKGTKNITKERTPGINTYV